MSSPPVGSAEPPESRDFKIGVFVTHQRPPERDPLTTLAEQLDLVRTARDGGLDSVFGGQHHLTDGLAHIQPLPWLARLTAEAGTMTVGTGVHLLALHNPVDTAEAYASLDVVAGGRSVFGVGLGYRQVEYDAFGVPFDQKVHRLVENLRIVEALWRGEAVTVDLPWCRLDGVRTAMLPVARPPIWMAANSDGAVRRAARLADTWLINPHATGETVRRQLELFTAERVAAGRPERPDELPLLREVFCAPTRELALERALPFLGAKYATYADWGQDQVMPDHESFRASIDELARDRFVVGTPDDCVAALAPWRDVGVDHLIVRTDWAGMPVAHARESLELIAREVAPALRAGR